MQQLPSFSPHFAEAEGRSVQNHWRCIIAQVVQKAAYVNLRLLDSGHVFQRGCIPLQLQFKHLRTGADPLQRIATLVGQTRGYLRNRSQPFSFQSQLTCCLQINHLVADS